MHKFLTTSADFWSRLVERFPAIGYRGTSRSPFNLDPDITTKSTRRFWQSGVHLPTKLVPALGLCSRDPSRYFADASFGSHEATSKHLILVPLFRF